MVDRDGRRWQLRLLDGCLQALEDANERDHVTVPEPVAMRVGPLVPAVLPGMPISDAITLVLHEQERYLDAQAMYGGPAPDVVEPPLDEAGARELTERIKEATREVCLLLFEAHRRRAWQALGYVTWEDYVHGEFGLSRTRSYELLDQGRVIRTLQAAAGISGIPAVSAYAAEQIKPYLGEVIEVIRQRTVATSEADALEVVVHAVRERRTLIARERRLAAAPELAETRDAQVGRGELVRLRAAIQNLASMPPVDEVVAKVEGVEAARLVQVDTALEWLAEFAIEWRKRHHPVACERLALIEAPSPQP
jgi:hypothetical protein